MATYNVDLARRGPGLLLAAIEKGDDAQIIAVADVIAEVSPDVLVITGFDYDRQLAALSAFAGILSDRGADYPHLFALRPNTGMATGLDLDGDGRIGGPGDAQGFGRFAGQGGMAVLSRLPIAEGEVRDFSALLWRDLPGALLPEVGGKPFPSDEALAVQRLSTTGHWAVPVVLPGGGRLTLLAWYGSPPVFDGPEDRNGRRSHDETVFWTALLDGRLDAAPPDAPFVILGDANIDPVDGDGIHSAINDLLSHPAVADPHPASSGGAAAADADHAGPPGEDTADWADGNPGNLRVDYVLPSADLTVTGAGVFWPAAGEPLAEAAAEASPHKLVWVDFETP